MTPIRSCSKWRASRRLRDPHRTGLMRRVDLATLRSLSRYADGCTHRKRGWSRGSIGVAVSSMRLRTRNSRSVVRASSSVQCRISWILRTPSACRPCSVSTGPRCTSASQRSCSCSGDISPVYNVQIPNRTKQRRSGGRAQGRAGKDRKIPSSRSGWVGQTVCGAGFCRKSSWLVEERVGSSGPAYPGMPDKFEKG